MWALKRLFCLILLAGYVSAEPPARPNVILVTLDTTRADRMGFLGCQRGLTPGLDALARQSVVFTHAYSQVPITTASHATILTGTFPQFHHVNLFGVPLAQDLPYLPQLLREQGYKTAAFVGSVILDPASGSAPDFDRGFDTYDAGFSGPQAGERRGGEVVARALTWLSSKRSGPFFLWVHLFDPHFPYAAPEPFKERYSSEPYDGEIAYTDSVVGQLLQQLRAKGLYDGAVIAVMADHGEAFGEHGERTHGIFLYDETIHVPLLFKLPANRFAGKRVDARAGLVDVVPTILELAGVPAPKAIQGASLVAAMNPQTSPGAASPDTADRPAYSETDYPQNFGWSSLQSMRTGKYLFIEAPRKEVYDQTTDPKAEHNLAPTASGVTATLSDRLDAFRSQTASSAQAQKVPMNRQFEQRLAALGYVSSSVSARASDSKQARADPKDKIEIANRYQDALVAEEAGRFDEVASIMEQLLAQEPGLGIGYRALGRALTALENFEKAIPVLRKALELNPDSSMDHYELGLALFYTGDLVSAKTELETAIAKSSTLGNPQSSANLHFTLAAVYNKMDRFTDAKKELETALQLDPDDYESNLTLGRLLAMHGEAAAGLPYLLKAAKGQPDSFDVHMFLADAYAKLGQQDDAQREMQQVRSLMEKQPQ